MQKIQKITEQNIDEVYDISKEQFGSESWTKEQFKECLKDNKYMNLVVYKNNKITSFLIAENLIDSTNILLLATKNEYKNKGFASLLMRKLINSLDKSKIWLEVKSTNFSAINFYKKFGFEFLYERKKYYKDGTSAVVLEKN